MPEVFNIGDQPSIKLGISVFYDKDSIEWGNNWSQKITEGLDKCDFGVVIVSKDFYDREWTEKELKSLLIRQNKNGDNIILPILYNTNLDEIIKHCDKSIDNSNKHIDKIIKGE